MEKIDVKIWRGRRVRIKREYLIERELIDEDLSTLDEDGNILIPTYVKLWETINMNNGFEGAVIIPDGEDLSTAVFKVRAEIYGIDLYGVKQGTQLSDLPKPSHQIIIEECGGFPYVWDAKYFEVVGEDFK